ncbi:hypothetical protein [Paenibacillus mendelii]|uniref:Spore coat protein n=1 Tax=Paenibacillus mendelii TaxID=206163 RepID=A0ABV6JKH1_9BACL|nr:hypothetical protein [Paenibacillus mendelii]MCQ6564030.1 hypothetical protein [Paenibacillus mendelii]
MEYGLANKNQVSFINQLENLQKLKISTVDAASLGQNTKLAELEITNTLKHAEVLSSAFPNMRKFS